MLYGGSYVFIKHITCGCIIFQYMFGKQEGQSWLANDLHAKNLMEEILREWETWN